MVEFGIPHRYTLRQVLQYHLKIVCSERIFDNKQFTYLKPTLQKLVAYSIALLLVYFALELVDYSSIRQYVRLKIDILPLSKENIADLKFLTQLHESFVSKQIFIIKHLLDLSKFRVSQNGFCPSYPNSSNFVSLHKVHKLQ